MARLTAPLTDQEVPESIARDDELTTLGESVGYLTKRTAYSCGMPTTTVAGAATEAVQRLEVALPVTTQRWRLHVRNWRPATGTVVTGAIPFNGVWIGLAAFNGTGASLAQCVGAFTAAPVQALGAFTTPADGSEHVTAWVTDPAMQFEALQTHLLSMGWVGGPTSQARAIGARGFYKGGAGVAADASAQTVTGGIPSLLTATVFDIWIEYEFVGTQPIGFALGDSLTSGYTSGSVDTTGVPLPASWPHAYGLLSGTPMINAGSSGLGAAGAISGTNGLYTKWGFGTDLTVPDFAIVWLGLNDAVGQQPVSSVSGYYGSIVTNLRALGIARIYLGLLPPFGVSFGFVHGRLLASVPAGATSLLTSVAFAGSAFLVLDYGLGTREQKQVEAGGSTGTGPYVTPIAATTSAHSAGAQVWATKEAVRRDFNAFLRTLPNGIQGVIDFERVLVSPADPFVLDPVVASSDLGHLNVEGYRRVAHAVPSRLVVPV